MPAEPSFVPPEQRHRSPPRGKQESAAAAGEEDSHIAGSCCAAGASARRRGRSLRERDYSSRGCIGVNGSDARRRSSRVRERVAGGRPTITMSLRPAPEVVARSTRRAWGGLGDTAAKWPRNWPALLPSSLAACYFCRGRWVRRRRGRREAQAGRMRGGGAARSHACWICAPADVASGGRCCARRPRRRLAKRRDWVSQSPPSSSLVRADTRRTDQMYVGGLEIPSNVRSSSCQQHGRLLFSARKTYSIDAGSRHERLFKIGEVTKFPRPRQALYEPESMHGVTDGLLPIDWRQRFSNCTRSKLNEP